MELWEKDYFDIDTIIMLSVLEHPKGNVIFLPLKYCNYSTYKIVLVIYRVNIDSFSVEMFIGA